MRAAPEIALKTVTDASDRDVDALASLLARTLADPNTVLDAERMREFIAASSVDRAFFVLVARRADEVVGGAVFSYVSASNCGFSEYIVTAPDVRGSGLGRLIFDERKRILNESSSSGRCNGLFIEVDNPERTPTEFLEAERITALDAHERLRIFGHMGFRRVDVRYVQPPLARDKEPVSYLDLLFAPWIEADEAIPSEWVVQTVEPVWRAWAPETYADELARLGAQLSGSRVELKSLDYFQ